jgi:hypothetical protein
LYCPFFYRVKKLPADWRGGEKLKNFNLLLAQIQMDAQIERF